MIKHFQFPFNFLEKNVLRDIETVKKIPILIITQQTQIVRGTIPTIVIIVAPKDITTGHIRID